MILALLVLACHPSAHTPPTLTELQALDDEAKAGERLMDAPMGLVRLDAPASPHDTAVVAVHGYESEGSEWVGSPQVIATGGAELYIYNWNWNQCPSTAVSELDLALDGLVVGDAALQYLVVIGHSQGGLVSVMWGQPQTAGRPAQLELIAAPLAGVDLRQKRCPGDGLGAGGPQLGNTWRQWRTAHEAEGAFRDMAVDPQVVTLPELQVTQLPAEWEGGRLGHNRSIQWVTAELAQTP